MPISLLTYVESGDEERVRGLVTNRRFQELWASCVQPANSRNVIDRCETKPYNHTDRQVQVVLNGFWALGRVHDLLIHTLEELADMGSASTEHVEYNVKPDWGVCSKKPEDETAWRAAEEYHFQSGLELSDRGKWTEAMDSWRRPSP